MTPASSTSRPVFVSVTLVPPSTGPVTVSRFTASFRVKPPVALNGPRSMTWFGAGAKLAAPAPASPVSVPAVMVAPALCVCVMPSLAIKLTTPVAVMPASTASAPPVLTM